MNGKNEEFCSLHKVNINQTPCHLQKHEASNKDKKAYVAASSNRKAIAFLKKDADVLKKNETWLVVAITCY